MIVYFFRKNIRKEWIARYVKSHDGKLMMEGKKSSSQDLMVLPVNTEAAKAFSII